MSTRLAQAGGEIQSIAEFPAESGTDAGTTSAAISSTKAYTGLYALRHQTTTKGRGLTIPATTQIKGGFFINHAGTSGTSASAKPVLLFLAPSSSSAHYVVWNTNTGNLEMYVNAVQVATYAVSGGFSTTNTWFHVGFTFKAHASAGYFTLYLNGVAILTYSGNTTNTNGIVAVLTGGVLVSQTATWANSMYIDDIWVDDDSGGADVAPASKRFLWSLANGAGASAQFTPLASTNISQVSDSGAPDDDTSYVYASAANLTDLYNTTDIAVPAGYAIIAAIPVAWAKRTNAAVASQLNLKAYDGANTETSPSAKTPTTTYGPVWDRFTTAPDGSTAWTQTGFNSAQFGFASAGSF
ncbi:MAG: hypothetical protein U0350_36400 [Caldilineaceae bacterium]